MSLADDVAAEIPFLRQQAESMMLDYGKALRETGDWTMVDGVEVKDADDLFEAPYKIQTRNLIAQVDEVGGRSSTTVRVELHLPSWTEPLATGDLWECITASPDSFEVSGGRWRVTGIAAGSLKTARRYEVERVLS